MNIENFKLTKKDVKEDGSFIIEGVVPKDEILSEKQNVLSDLAKEKKIDGFRDGKAPKDVVEKEVGELSVWQQTAQSIISKHFVEILASVKLSPIGQPQLQILSASVNNDVSFKLKLFSMPEVKLGDYKETLKTIEKRKSFKRICYSSTP